MQTGMNIGTVVSKESLEPLADAIVRIMEARADQETVRAGLSALIATARVDGVTIQNCVVNGDRSVTVEVDAENGNAEIRYTPTNNSSNKEGTI